MGDLEGIQLRLKQFRDARDWGQFHSPKNLVAAIANEAAELQELLVWSSEEQSWSVADARRNEVEQELADVLIQCLNLAERLGIDVVAACERKIELNDARYPVDKAKGSATKYDEL